MLQKQAIPLSFENGIDTKRDDKQQVFGVFRKAENVIFETIGTFKKRNGYDLIAPRKLDDTLSTTAQALATFNSELLMFEPSELLAYSPSMQRLSSKGNTYSASVTGAPVVNNTYTHDQVDGLVLENFEVYVYRNSSLNQIRYSVRDRATNSFLVSDVLVGSGKQPQVATIQGTVYLLYVDGTNLKHRRFSIATPETLAAAITVASNVDTNSQLDCESTANLVFVAYNSSNAGGELTVFSIDSTGTASTAIGITGFEASKALDVYIDSVGRLIITFADATDVYYMIMPTNLGSPLLSPTLVSATADVMSCSAIESGSSYLIYYTKEGTTYNSNTIFQATANLAGTVSASTIFQRGASLASKQFAYNGDTYVTVGFASPLQSTYFVLCADQCVVAKISPSNGGGEVKGTLVKAVAVSDTAYSIPTLIKTRLDVDSSTFFSVEGINGTIVEFAPSNPFLTATVGGNMLIVGSVPQLYDGDVVSEHGFHLYPEDIALSSSSSTGGLLNDGVRDYVAVYRWTDNLGQEHRSAASPSTTVTLSGGTSTQKSTITVPTLRITSKSEVVIELYRTENAGTIFYKVTTETSPQYSDKTVDTINIEDTISDAVLISREPLYSTGGVLENAAPPSAMLAAAWMNRIVLAGLEQPNTLQFSKYREEGRAVEFAAELRVPIERTRGPITAVAGIAEKLIIFEANSCRYMTGDGPNNLGQQDTWSAPEVISTDVGCVEPRSIVLTKLGLMFKSNKGIYLLDSSLNLSYIGDRVEQFNSLAITSAQIVADKNQVRFTTSSGPCLVFNYERNTWGTFANHAARSAIVVDNDYYYLRTDGSLFKESSSFADNGTPIKLSVETGWISFDNLQGFMRVYKMLLLGTYKSAHKIRVEVAYDFVEAWVQEKIVDLADVVTTTTYGQDTPYGNSSPYGGSGSPYQIRFDLKKQKCQSIKFRISDVQTSAGEGLSLSAVTFEVGGKSGIFRPAQSKVYGTK